MKKDLETVEKISKDLLKRLGFPEAEISLSQDEEQRIHLQINVPVQDSGLLIGFHGETISALQLIIGQMVASKLGEWKPIIVNIGDYREKREEALKNMALNVAFRVKESNQPVTMPYLNSSERRTVHLILSEDQDVETFSEGEGRQRRLIVALKKQTDNHKQEESKEKMDEEKK